MQTTAKTRLQTAPQDLWAPVHDNLYKCHVRPHSTLLPLTNRAPANAHTTSMGEAFNDEIGISFDAESSIMTMEEYPTAEG